MPLCGRHCSGSRRIRHLVNSSQKCVDDEEERGTGEKIGENRGREERFLEHDSTMAMMVIIIIMVMSEKAMAVTGSG